MTDDREMIPASRGPMLSVGLVVAGGRYRLDEDCGGSAGRRFFRAHDLGLNREVAITFFDPEETDAGPQQLETALRDTIAVADLKSPGLASIFDIIRGAVGAIVVAEWTPGSTLADSAFPAPSLAAAESVGTVPDGNRRVDAIARLVYPLAIALDAAHKRGAALGLDEPARLRATTFPGIRLAFPGPRSGHTITDDRRGFASTVQVLAGYSWVDGQQPLEAPLRSICDTAHADGSLSEAVEAAIQGPNKVEESQRNATASELTEARSMSMGKWAAIGGVLAAAFIGGVIVVSWLMGLVGSDSQDRSLNEQLSAIQQEARSERENTAATSTSNTSGSPALSSTPSKTAVPVEIASVTPYQPASSAGTPENADQARNVVDSSDSTLWSTETYLSQLGETPPSYKSGIGLMLTLKEPIAPHSVTVASPSVGTKIEVRIARSGQPSTISDTELVGTEIVQVGETTIDLTGDQETMYVLIWITQLDQQSQSAYSSKISEIEVLG